MKPEITIVRHINSLGCELTVDWCRSKSQVRSAVLSILDYWEDGDSITFQVVSE